MTNHSPQEIIFGQTHDDIPQMPTNEEFQMSNTPTKYIEYMNKRRNIIENNTRKYQRYYDEQRTKHMKVYSNKNPNTRFEVGDLVLYYNGDKLIGNTKKLTTNWIGPFEITALYNDGMNADIVNIHESKMSMEKINVNKLKIWRPKDEALWMEAPFTYAFDSLNTKIERARLQELLHIERNFAENRIPQQHRNVYHNKTAEKVSTNKIIQKCINTIEKLVDVNEYVKNYSRKT